MNEILEKLSGKTRAEAWNCFKKLALAGAWNIKNELDSEKIAELRKWAEKFNEISETEFFDLTVSDEEFIEFLFSNLEKIRKAPRHED